MFSAESVTDAIIVLWIVVVNALQQEVVVGIVVGYSLWLYD